MELECQNCHITLEKSEIELKYKNRCPMCGKINTFIDEYIMDIKRISSDESFVSAMIKLHNENPIEYQLKIQQFKTQLQQQKQVEEKGIQSSNQRKCKYCGSTSFTPVKRKWSPLMGLLTDKTDLICNNCGKKFK